MRYYANIHFEKRNIKLSQPRQSVQCENANLNLSSIFSDVFVIANFNIGFQFLAHCMAHCISVDEYTFPSNMFEWFRVLVLPSLIQFGGNPSKLIIFFNF